MSTVIGVVTFPGSLDDRDAVRAVARSGATAVRLWHADRALHGVDAVVLPGGFSYGDYLRCGAIARFAAVMESIADAVKGGLPVLGVCNGFQILCEAHLLPGALTRNQHLHFRNRDQRLRIESVASAWTNAFAPNQEIVIPVKNGE
jgi:phosphoribosylformylglycinamidine synthase